jgi:predicted permease
MPQVRQIADRITERLAVLPGVSAVGIASTAPFSAGNNQQNVVVQGREPGPNEPVPVASVRRVSLGYFDAVGTRLIEGRGFTPGDRDSAERVAVIDETLARRYWPGGSALGNRITNDGGDNPVWRTVVGVAASIRHQSLDRAPDHYVYYPLAQSNAWSFDLIVRSSAADGGLAESIRRELAGVDPDLPLYQVHTLAEAVSRSVATRRLTHLVLSGFALCAVILAAIGIYGVMTRTVAARVREFGVRLALGARPGQIETLVLRQGLRLVLIGTVIGAVGALGTTRLLRTLLYEVSPADPATFVLAALLLGGVALVACWIPARRATDADPLEALRGE